MVGFGAAVDASKRFAAPLFHRTQNRGSITSPQLCTRASRGAANTARYAQAAGENQPAHQ